MCHVVKIHTIIAEHLGGFQSQALINNAALNILVKFFLVHICISLGFMPRNGIT